MARKANDTEILDALVDEVRDMVETLTEFSPHETRADYLRIFRAALELLPAVPKGYGSKGVYERPRGVKYD